MCEEVFHLGCAGALGSPRVDVSLALCILASDGGSLTFSHGFTAQNLVAELAWKALYGIAWHCMSWSCLTLPLYLCYTGILVLFHATSPHYRRDCQPRSGTGRA